MEVASAKSEAGLQVDQRSMRVSDSNKTSRCKIHTSATGGFGWEKRGKVNPLVRLPDSRGLYTPAAVKVTY